MGDRFMFQPDLSARRASSFVIPDYWQKNEGRRMNPFFCHHSSATFPERDSENSTGPTVNPTGRAEPCNPHTTSPSRNSVCISDHQ